MTESYQDKIEFWRYQEGLIEALVGWIMGLFA
jgi:hypothetical protein